MAGSFGGSVKLTGESEYRKALQSITSELKTMANQMKAVTSIYGQNHTSVANLTEKDRILNTQIGLQTEKIIGLNAQIREASQKYGENSTQVNSLKEKLNLAHLELVGLDKELETNKKALDEATKGEENLNDASRTIINSLGDFTAELLKDIAGVSKFGNVLKNDMSVRFEDTKEGIKTAVDNVRQFGSTLIDNIKHPKNLGNAIKEGLINTAEKLQKGTKDNTKSIEELGKAEEETTKKTSIFGDVLKANLSADLIKSGLNTIISGIKSIGNAMGNLVIQGGFDRAMNIEQAQFKLKGLGHDTEAIDGIMKNALASVKGTAYALDDAVTISASLVASGIKQGDDLERALKLVGDASAISGRSLTEMGNIFNKVATAGKLSGEEVNQLHQSGIPIIQLLANTMGKSTEEIQKMVSAGKIGFAEFQDAVEKGMGGSALTIGQTFTGARDNLKTSFARMGAEILTPFTESLTPALGLITNLIDDVASGTVENIESRVSEIGDIVKTAVSGLIGNIAPILQTAIPVVVGLIKEISGMLPSLLNELLPIVVEGIMSIINAIIESLPTFIQTAVDIVIALATGLAETLPDLIPIIVDAVILIVETIIDNIDLIIDAGINIIFGLIDGLIKALPQLIEKIPVIIDKLVNAITNNLPKIIQAGITLIIKLAEGLIKAIPQLVSQIPQIISSIVNGLLSGLGQLAEVGLNLVKGLWNGISNATGWILDKIKGFGESVLNGIKSFFGIHSPSTLFRDEIGKNLAYGVGIGFEEGMDKVVDEMQDALPTDFETNANMSINNKSILDNMPSNDLSFIRIFGDFLSKFERIYTAPNIVINTNDLNQEKLDLIFRDIDRRFGLSYN